MWKSTITRKANSDRFSGREKMTRNLTRGYCCLCFIQGEPYNLLLVRFFTVHYERNIKVFASNRIYGDWENSCIKFCSTNGRMHLIKSWPSDWLDVEDGGCWTVIRNKKAKIQPIDARFLQRAFLKPLMYIKVPRRIQDVSNFVYGRNGKFCSKNRLLQVV